MFAMTSGVRGVVFVQLVFVVVSCLLICPSTSDLSRYCTLDDLQHTRGVCGNRLSNMVATICNGQYNTRKMSLSVDSSIGFLHKRMAASFLQYNRGPATSGRSYQQGIVCECCVHQCGFMEIMEYCGTPTTTTSTSTTTRAPFLGGLDGDSLE